MTPAGLPHSEIPGSKPVWRLPEAYRSPPRPSSPVSAKASTDCPWNLLVSNNLFLHLTLFTFQRTIQDFRLECATMLLWTMTALQVETLTDVVLVEVNGFEPMTPCLQGKCSPN